MANNGEVAPVTAAATHVDPCLFVSYARDDAQYADRLREHLVQHGLPVWMQTDLAWGSAFPREIAERIGQALAMLVIMSPGAQKSEWVEREILEGQHHGRQFLPILRAGNRLFLLASSNYFDARSGALPGARELRQLRAVCDAAVSPAVGRKPTLDTPRAPAPVRPATLTASAGLGKLTALLQAGRLEHADILTTSVLLEAVDRLDTGWLRQADGARLPSDLVTEVDRAWSTATDGRHGFLAQIVRYDRPPTARCRAAGGTSLRWRWRWAGGSHLWRLSEGICSSRTAPSSHGASSPRSVTPRPSSVRSGTTNGWKP
jgi:hypothetical protein